MLSLQNLDKRYGSVVALDDASFEVPGGRIVGFLGPNGAGKTTAMRCVFGLVRPDRGQVLWNDHRVGQAERLQFGYMPEERGLYPKMKVREQLAYFGRLSGLDGTTANERADYWLSRLGLSDRALDETVKLSHGNQQRVQLGTALIHQPTLLVLDEPFAGLDPLGMETMAGLLAELAATGVGIVFSSHQLDLVEDVCEDVVIINHGRVVLSGTVATLKAASGRRHLQVSVDGKAWLPDMEGVELVPGANTEPRYLLSSAARLDEVLARAQMQGEVTTFTVEPPSLTDLFREAVES
ncbi:MAG: ATP-binding cassette domain-containing protein [Acidimicrobiia bacterium]|nr:ATP-binding cassette domain-containing protein [Acidimicrobiia bacterium]MDH3398830.1 ATP-binding cassette domain-containing protein [Acidimicrobiia bacterium]MDH5616599.1 ATP-binding cassette domain-containing protein [Acidimicrobiia bacterium]